MPGCGLAVDGSPEVSWLSHLSIASSGLAPARGSVARESPCLVENLPAVGEDARAVDSAGQEEVGGMARDEARLHLGAREVVTHDGQARLAEADGDLRPLEDPSSGAALGD